MKPVIIVGGGLAGLAAGVSLSREGIPVLVLEQRPAAGGRAASFVDPDSGEAIDFGQHVMIAAYARTLRLLETIGTRHLVAIQETPSLAFHHPDRGLCSFSLPPYPGDLAMLGGVLGTDLFSTVDRLRVLRAGLALKRFRPDAPGPVASMTIRGWLDAHGQSAETRRSFWEPLAIAIMNEHIETASALVFLRALKIAFHGEPGGSSLVIARTGLSEIFATSASDYIQRHGGELRPDSDVTETLMAGGRVSGIRLKGGKKIEGRAVILAVPSHRVRGLLPEELEKQGYLREVERITLSPIISLHIWFPSDFMPQDFVGIIGGHAQWVFNRRKIEQSKMRGGHLSVVISAAGDLVERSQEELTEMALADLRRVYGEEVETPDRSIVVRERRATFSCTPETERLRPGSATPVGNLFLAGDWTATGLPATIEGAVISGETAAAGVRKSP